MTSRTICGHGAVAGHCDQCDKTGTLCTRVDLSEEAVLTLTVQTTNPDEIRRHVEIRAVESAISTFAEKLRQVYKHDLDENRRAEAQRWREELSACFVDEGLEHLL